MKQGDISNIAEYTKIIGEYFKQHQKIIKVFIVLLGMCVSFFCLANKLTTYDYHEKTINALEDKKDTVLELTAAASASSAAITLLPGDTATPIAEQLADMTTYFLIAICAIYLENIYLQLQELQLLNGLFQLQESY